MTDARLAARPPISMRAWIVLALMTTEYVLANIDRNNVAILKTTIKAVFGLSDASYSMLVSAFLVPYAIFYIVCGRLVDRYGSRRMFTAFVLIWSAATIAAGAAQSFAQMLAARLVLGAAEAGLLPATIYALVRWFPRDRLATVYAIKNPLQALGPILSPPLIAYLALSFGWRWAFVMPGVIGLIGGLLWWFLDRGAPYEADDENAALQATGGLMPLLRNPALTGILLARAVTDPVYFFFQNWQAGYLQERLGYSLKAVGSLLWIPAAVNVIAVFATALWSDRMIRRGRQPVDSRLAVIIALSGVGLTVALIPLFRTPFPVIALYTLAYIVGFGWLYLSNIMMADLFPKGQVASAVGLVNCVGTAGAALFNSVIGSVLDRHGYAPVWIFLSLLYPLGALILWRRYGFGNASGGMTAPATPTSS